MRVSQAKVTFFVSGFTLIELLVVIVVIGLLAGVVSAAINPGEKFAQSRDSERKVKVTELGKAIEAYAIDNASYPLQGVTWMNILVPRGYIKSIVSAVSGNRLCTGYPAQNNFCYHLGVGSAASHVYTYVESSTEAKKCAGGVGGASSTVYYVYDTSLGRTCIKCNSNILSMHSW